MTHMLYNLKNVKTAKTFFGYYVTFFTDDIIYQHLLQETKLLLAFVRFQTLVLFFLWFQTFCELQCLFYKNNLVLTFTMEIFYFVLTCSGLKTIKLKRWFFLQTSDKSAIQNKALMQLHLHFHKTVNRNKPKVRSKSLVFFQQIRKL